MVLRHQHQQCIAVTPYLARSRQIGKVAQEIAHLVGYPVSIPMSADKLDVLLVGLACTSRQGIAPVKDEEDVFLGDSIQTQCQRQIIIAKYMSTIGLLGIVQRGHALAYPILGRAQHHFLDVAEIWDRSATVATARLAIMTLLGQTIAKCDDGVREVWFGGHQVKCFHRFLTRSSVSA